MAPMAGLGQAEVSHVGSRGHLLIYCFPRYAVRVRTVLLWHAGIVGRLIHCATMPAPLGPVASQPISISVYCQVFFLTHTDQVAMVCYVDSVGASNLLSLFLKSSSYPAATIILNRNLNLLFLKFFFI